MEEGSTANGHQPEEESLHKEIQIIEAQLAAAKAKLQSSGSSNPSPNPPLQNPTPSTQHAPNPPQSLHLWLLLADSALPIGSFAFSSGLESYISHRTLRHPLSGPKKPTPRSELSRFLRLSLLSVSTTTIPFVASAFQTPSSAPELDDIFDATTTCEVARRASVSQGRALCSVWDKSFVHSLLTQINPTDNSNSSSSSNNIPHHHRPDHFGVAWGYITRLSGADSLHQVLFVFLFNHVKAVLSAAVRLSLIGPYVAQQILASEETQRLVLEAVERGKGISVDEAGQCVPTLDLWQGRHEKLYTRIFNS
ncbi:hypothetical protein H072_326 [Dactylellina haptotyla CBS 200.50]|uniref:Urease accessory protein UreF n=1 Tax=Dactylellina haptotyla (strain CBS 200.50) TaxID=1284197 RepID=S8AS21_DACHA|nr:hypothetical protein H072_326 [Dactylellina haptotyla CBS 200.50]